MSQNCHLTGITEMETCHLMILLAQWRFSSCISITIHPTLHISAELQKQTIWQLNLSTKRMKRNQDEGAWNDAMAGGTCLGLVPRIVEDDVVPLVKKNRPSTEFQKLKASETPNKLDNKC
ncbi:hypothetical protein Tco_0162920 [Tanacetum coccineum]